MGAVQVVENVLERLAAFEPVPFPVISLYLNTQADGHGKDRWQPFARKELHARAKTYAQHSSERASFDADIDRIETYLNTELQPSANGAAIFACHAAGLFEAVQLEAPVQADELHVSDQPHLYTLAKLNNQYRRYAALVTDTNTARIFVFGLCQIERKGSVVNEKPALTRSNAGGWSQARYQRRVENQHLLHAKEIVDTLDRIVTEEKIDYIVLAGDEVIMPVLKEQIPKHLTDKVVDVLRLDIRTPERDVLEASLESMRQRDAQDDAEKVKRALDQYRAGGLGVVGPKETLAALEIGQVEELLITANPDDLRENGGRLDSEALSQELVNKAERTSALVTFIENPDLLREVGGVAALLRFRT